MPVPFDRRAIMLEAWTIVRRFQGNGEPLRKLLSRVLRDVWWDAKRNREMAAKEAQRRAAELELISRPVDDLRAEITILENRTTLRSNGRERLRELRHALAQASNNAAVTV